MYRLLSLWTVAAIMTFQGCILGCAFIRPTTEIKFSPLSRTISIFNTKDVDLSFDDLSVEWTETTGKLNVTAFTVSDKSSPVIEANVEQMLAFAEQQRAANEGIIGSLNAIGDMVGLLTGAMEAILRGSGLEIDTPWGSGSATLGPATQPATVSP